MADNKSIQKIFSLSDIRKKQLVGDVPERTRESYREYGYFGGGDVALSSVERVDYSNDTITGSVRGSLPIVSRRSGASGNTNFAYYAEGNSGSAQSNPFGESRIFRVNYSNDTISSRGEFPRGHFRDAATGNINYGYFGGGEVYLAQDLSLVDRINYSNDLANALVRGPLSSARSYLSATGNSNFGYFAGGSGGVLPAMRINYANDTTVGTIRGILNSPMGSAGSTGNNNFGYFCGGVFTRLERIDYSNDTQTSTRRFLTGQKNSTEATGNSNFGYFSGGIIPGTPNTLLSLIERIDYSNDSATASIRGPMSTERYVHATTSSHSFGGTQNSSFASNFTFPTVPNAGYFGGGFDGTNNLATIDKVDYANDTSTASVRSALSVARYGLAATGNGSFGYFGGGFIIGPTTFYSTVDRLEYSSDTQNTITRGSLSVSRGALSATGNSNFGYFGGGYIPGIPGSSSTVDRIDYTTDTSAASPRGLLILGRYGPGATGNQNFGYFAGGVSPSASSSNAKSEIQRIDYSADLMTALNRSTLTGSRYVIAATGNSNFGYFGGGHFPASVSFSNIQRLDYSNDTQTSINRGNLSTARGRVSAAGSLSFGFFGSGTTVGNPSGNISTTDRINYSNDTAVASIRGPLSTAKSSLAATSPLAYGGAPIYFTNPLPEVLQKQIEFDDSNTLDLPFKRVLGSYGYVYGGGTSSTSPTSTFSQIRRLDYSNDTVIDRGFLSSALIYSGATGNKNYGYHSGALGTYGSVNRLDHSNDIAICSLRAYIPNLGAYACATGNNNFGYFTGNSFTGGSSISRINYSNDLASPQARTNTSDNREYIGATGNTNFGYFGGGFVPGPTNKSIVERITYSNDTANVSIRGPLAVATIANSATGNNNFGYFCCGSTTSLVQRIDYSNDTGTISLRGSVSTRNQSVATGNSNFGYIGANAFGGSSTVDRINYANDLSTPSTKAVFSVPIGYRPAATTNARNS